MSLGAAIVMLSQALPYNGAECDQALADSGVQYEMNVCAWREHEAADAELNAVWKTARDFAKQNDREFRQSPFYREDDEGRYFALLLAQQRAWLQYRDTSCVLKSDRYRTGSMRPMVYSMCMTSMTRNRTLDLMEYMERDG